jgi:outer membrane autotransporter protein
MAERSRNRSCLIAATTLCGALVTLPSSIEAACFEPNQSESGQTSGCAIDGYVTGQIATPGSKLIGRFLQQKVSADLIGESNFEFQPLSYMLPEEVNSVRSVRSFAPLADDSFSIAQALNGAPETVDPARLGRVGSPTVAFYATGLISDESQDRTSREASSDTTRWVGGVGVQIVRPDWLLGIGIDVSNADIDYGRFKTVASNENTFTSPRSEQSTDEYGLQLFGLKFFSDLFLQGSIRAAYTDSSIDRYNLSISEPDGLLLGTDRTRGDTNGYSFSGFVGAGQILRPTARIALIVSGGLDVTYFNTDGYQEKLTSPSDDAGNTPALRFEDDDSLSVTSVIEARLQTTIEVAGVNFQPSVAGRYFHEFADDARDIDYSFATGFAEGEEEGTRQNASFKTNSPDRNYYHLEAGLAVPISERLLFDIAVTKLLGHSFRDEESISVGFRVAF